MNLHLFQLTHGLEDLMRKKACASLFLMAMALLEGCSGGGDLPSVPPPPPAGTVAAAPAAPGAIPRVRGKKAPNGAPAAL